MSTYRKWDESRSPQWKYLFQKESAQRRKTRKEIEKERKVTQSEKDEWKEVIKDKRILSKARKRGNNIKKYSRIGGVMTEISQTDKKTTLEENVKIMYQNEIKSTT